MLCPSVLSHVNPSVAKPHASGHAGDDTPETMSFAPSSPTRAWVERRLRGCAWAAAQVEDTPARTHCPACRKPRDQRSKSSGPAIYLDLAYWAERQRRDVLGLPVNPDWWRGTSAGIAQVGRQGAAVHVVTL